MKTFLVLHHYTVLYLAPVNRHHKSHHQLNSPPISFQAKTRIPAPYNIGSVLGFHYLPVSSDVVQTPDSPSPISAAEEQKTPPPHRGTIRKQHTSIQWQGFVNVIRIYVPR